MTDDPSRWMGYGQAGLGALSGIVGLARGTRRTRRQGLLRSELDRRLRGEGSSAAGAQFAQAQNAIQSNALSTPGLNQAVANRNAAVGMAAASGEAAMARAQEANMAATQAAGLEGRDDRRRQARAMGFAGMLPNIGQQLLTSQLQREQQQRVQAKQGALGDAANSFRAGSATQAQTQGRGGGLVPSSGFGDQALANVTAAPAGYNEWLQATASGQNAGTVRANPPPGYSPTELATGVAGPAQARRERYPSVTNLRDIQVGNQGEDSMAARAEGLTYAPAERPAAPRVPSPAQLVDTARPGPGYSDVAPRDRLMQNILSGLPSEGMIEPGPGYEAPRLQTSDLLKRDQLDQGSRKGDQGGDDRRMTLPSPTERAVAQQETRRRERVAPQMERQQREAEEVVFHQDLADAILAERDLDWGSDAERRQYRDRLANLMRAESSGTMTPEQARELREILDGLERSRRSTTDRRASTPRAR